MNLNSSVDTIYGELSERQDCLDWLHERTGQNWYVVSIEEGYAFEIVHYLMRTSVVVMVSLYLWYFLP